MPEGNGPVAAPPIVMQITYDPSTNHLKLDGVPPSHVLAYGTLVLAMDALQQSRQSQVAQSPILRPGPVRLA